MFQSVRPNSQLYVLHNDKQKYIEMPTVVSVSLPKAKYPLPTTFGQPQELVVDIIVKINNQDITYRGLPAQQDISDSYSNGESIVVADSKEAINTEILNLKQKRLDTLNNIEVYKQEVQEFDTILKQLNPEFAEKEEQKKELETLKTQMQSMAQSISELMQANRSLIEQLSHRRLSNENVGN